MSIILAPGPLRTTALTDVVAPARRDQARLDDRRQGVRAAGIVSGTAAASGLLAGVASLSLGGYPGAVAARVGIAFGAVAGVAALVGLHRHLSS